MRLISSYLGRSSRPTAILEEKKKMEILKIQNQSSNEVLEFIHRRFPVDCNWLSGNCFYFAIILKSNFKSGDIYYDVINGHFLFLYDGKYYDWSGIVIPDGVLIRWKDFKKYDPLQYDIIVRDCVQ